jgi:rhodanese-related sulfurtransferase
MNDLYKQIPPSEFDKLISNLKDNELIVDVRTPSEFEQSRLRVANPGKIVNKDVNEIIRQTDFSEFKGKKVFLICESGSRSGLAQQFLADAGIEAINMNGGMISARRLGLTV